MLDLILGGLLIYGAIRGAWNGFIMEFAALISLFAGIWVALEFAHYFKALLEVHTTWNPQMILILSFGLPFIITLIAIVMVAKFFTSLAGVAGLGIFNKIGGAVLGVIKMCLILGVALNFFANINYDQTYARKETLDQSIFFNPILKTGSAIYPIMQGWYTENRDGFISTP